MSKSHAEILAAAVTKSEDVIAHLARTKTFRAEGLTLEQWCQIRESYIMQLEDVLREMGK